ncbi:hypothetical protein SDJN02_15881, partial [Cucurbita argyrosperma subsp. argyrosperma]
MNGDDQDPLSTRIQAPFHAWKERIKRQAIKGFDSVLKLSSRLIHYPDRIVHASLFEFREFDFRDK